MRFPRRHSQYTWLQAPLMVPNQRSTRITHKTASLSSCTTNLKLRLDAQQLLSPLPKPSSVLSLIIHPTVPCQSTLPGSFPYLDNEQQCACSFLISAAIEKDRPLQILSVSLSQGGWVAVPWQSLQPIKKRGSSRWRPGDIARHILRPRKYMHRIHLD